MDDSGMTDVPMRLMIAAVLTALMVPLVMGAYEDLSRTVAQDRALAEMARIARAGRAVMDGDVGSCVSLTIDVRGFGSVQLEKGTIGATLMDGPTAEAYTIVFDMGSLGEVSTVPEPLMAMTGPDGSSGLTITEGENHLTVTHVSVGGVHAASFMKA